MARTQKVGREIVGLAHLTPGFLLAVNPSGSRVFLSPVVRQANSKIETGRAVTLTSRQRPIVATKLYFLRGRGSCLIRGSD